MINPLFEICASSPAVTALIGSDPVRLYAFGCHDDEVVYPYVTWQNTGGAPELYLGTRPDIDRWSVQVDIWARTADEAVAVASALRDATESRACITRWGGQTRDSETLSYRFSFDMDWLVSR
ncbi:TPA: DUF3168 domain-containing protein [Escherichia coli]|nr:DUF3168 domain-containing protein [Escherichia coli]HEL8044808.1 DUF3168 domain-containing protein [Escherichia coli]HEL8049441.1 DUF3168 domain-containing protein [Escherichia coli]HEL8059204.1 DUF3168 domain-containing protein [Escherichia coli]HEL8103642.1 DUF3168 domain-containing protein [Escherichia coli]